MEGEEVSLRLKSESDFAVPSLRFASFILPKAFLNRVGFPMAGGGGGGEIVTDWTHVILYVTRFFSIRNAWFTRVFLIKGLFTIGSV